MDIHQDNTCACSCGKPQAYDLSCPYIIATFGRKRVDHLPYISQCCIVESHKSTYAAEFHIILDRFLCQISIQTQESLSLHRHISNVEVIVHEL